MLATSNISSAEKSMGGQPAKKTFTGTKNDLFYLSFLQKFSFSLTLSLKDLNENAIKPPIHHSNSQAQGGVYDFIGLEESFTPTEQLIQILFGKEEDVKSHNSNVHISASSVSIAGSHNSGSELLPMLNSLHVARKGKRLMMEEGCRTNLQKR